MDCGNAAEAVSSRTMLIVINLHILASLRLLKFLLMCLGFTDGL
jgi:hypothetical protein